MAIVHKFDAPNRNGTAQYVAHGVNSSATACPKVSMWFSPLGLVDAETFDKAGRARGVVIGSSLWKDLERKVPGLIAQHEAGGE